MANLFDSTPSGFVRSKSKGWLAPAPSPQKKVVEKLKQENADLKQRLEQLESMVEQLVSKKK